MFKQRTLFVVGAGGSQEFGLPVGNTLAATIAKKMDIQISPYGGDSSGSGDKIIDRQLCRYNGTLTNQRNAAYKLIGNGIMLSNSIDDFLDVHEGNEHVKRIGKMAIVKSILEAERKSKLFVDRSNSSNALKMPKIEDTWIIKFFRMLGRGLRLSDVEYLFQNVAFVVFNYDRCIEQFLLYALQAKYDLSEHRACSILNDLTIIHPYGMVAPLATSQQPNGVYFGGGGQDIDQVNYLALADRIKTYTEQVEEGDELERIRKEVERASTMVFLGFAFHDPNLNILRPKKKGQSPRIFGTVCGMSESDIEVIDDQISRLFAKDLSFESEVNGTGYLLKPELTCSQLFDYYTKSLPA